MAGAAASATGVAYGAAKLVDLPQRTPLAG